MLRLGPGRWLNTQLQLLSWLGEDLHGDSFLAEQRPQGRALLVKLMHSDACRSASYHERFRRCAERAMALSHRHMPTLRAFGFLSAPLEAAALIGPTPSGGRGGRQSSSSSLSSSGLTPLPGLSSLTPPVPSIFPQVVSQVIPWVATDPAEGTDLRTLLLDGISPLALGRLLLPIADLLDRAAALSLCHGELSPREILLVDAATEGGLSPGSVREGRPMLLDLGLAKVVAENPLDIPMPPELLWYRSPEQCQSGLRVDAASDRYALAAILFEGVAGRPPFLAQSAPALLLAHRVAPVPPLRSLLRVPERSSAPPRAPQPAAPRSDPDLSARPSRPPVSGGHALVGIDRAPALDAFFVRALAKQPEARFPSATAMIEEFLNALGEAAAGPIPLRRRSPRWYRLLRQRIDGTAVGVDVVAGTRAVLGKQPGCDVVCQALPSPRHDAITGRISREHAVLIWLDDRLSILDQSKSGTFVNGRRTGQRLWPVPDRALLRFGETLTLKVELLDGTPGGPRAPLEGAEEGAVLSWPEAIGMSLQRQDEYAAGAPLTLMLWGRAPLAATPLVALGGELAAGQIFVAQRELWYGGHPAVSWRRRDGTVVLGAAPLRAGDTLSDSAGTLTVER